MDITLRELQRKYEASGSIEDGVNFLNALLRVGSVDLNSFPLAVLQQANLPLSCKSRECIDFRSKHQLYGYQINELLGQIQELIQPYWEAHQGQDAFENITLWFAQHGLPEEQAEASQQVVLEEEDYYDMPPYDSEDIFYDLVVWYPTIPEIRVFTASQYADTYGDIRADFSSGSGRAEVPKNLPAPIGLLREFIFRFGPNGPQLVGINVVAHQQGLWSHKPRLEAIENLITTSQWQPYNAPLPTADRLNFLIVYDDLMPNLPMNTTPRIIRGSCEDYPACGHDMCPPRWSHTGRQVGMICAICGGEMPPGPSSIHPACMRRSLAQEDPYYYGDEDYEDEDDEGDFLEDRAWYEEGDDYGY